MRLLRADVEPSVQVVAVDALSVLASRDTVVQVKPGVLDSRDD